VLADERRVLASVFAALYLVRSRSHVRRPTDRASAAGGDLLPRLKHPKSSHGTTDRNSRAQASPMRALMRSLARRSGHR
jgi:hypothetical protein